MNYSLIDAGGLCLSVLAYVPLVLLPGLILAEVFGPLGFHQASPAQKLTLATVVGLALAPLIDTMFTRFLGLDAALAFSLALSMAGLALAVRRRWPIQTPPGTRLLLGVWLLVVLVEWIDFDIGGGLYRSFTIIDMVKHAATTQAIHDTGAPPVDPFFARPGRVGYYYFFYTVAALGERLCGGLASARMAVAGLAFWVGVGVFGLCRTVMERSGLARVGSGPSRTWLLLGVMAIGGLDVLPVLWLRLGQGTWLPDPLSWNEQITGWLESLLWVPHHLVGLIAAFAGMATLAELAQEGARGRVAAILFAGLCFASAAGLSVWVTFAAALAVAVWLGLLLLEKRMALAGLVVLAGLVALVAASPYLLQLQAGRAHEGAQIVLTVRAFNPADTLTPHGGPLRLLVRLALLPLNYLFEFGLLLVGAALFWRRRIGQPHPTELARILTIASATGLVAGSFLKSTLYNNDLGWRVALFPIMGFTIWTTIQLQESWVEAGALTWMQRLRATPLLACLVATVGAATNIYALAALRLYPFMPTPPAMHMLSASAPTQRELRTAYEWAAGHLPAALVLQHDAIPPRAFDFGLYGRNRTAVSDSYGSLYGADSHSVTMRLHEVFPIFETKSSTSEVLAEARRLGADDLVVSANDPAWIARADWIGRSRPIYATPRVRIIPVAALGSEK